MISHGTAHFGPSSLLVALERAARGTGYSLSIANSFEDDPTGLAGAVDSLLAQGVDAIILSEPVEDGDEALVIDVPVLTLGQAPTVHAPTVLSMRAAEGGEAAAEVTRSCSRWDIGRFTTSPDHSAGGRPVNGDSAGWTRSSPPAPRYRMPWRATGPHAGVTRSDRCSRGIPL